MVQPRVAPYSQTRDSPLYSSSERRKKSLNRPSQSDRRSWVTRSRQVRCWLMHFCSLHMKYRSRPSTGDRLNLSSPLKINIREAGSLLVARREAVKQRARASPTTCTIIDPSSSINKTSASHEPSMLVTRGHRVKLALSSKRSKRELTAPSSSSTPSTASLKRRCNKGPTRLFPVHCPLLGSLSTQRLQVEVEDAVVSLDL